MARQRRQLRAVCSQFVSGRRATLTGDAEFSVGVHRPIARIALAGLTAGALSVGLLAAPADAATSPTGPAISSVSGSTTSPPPSQKAPFEPAPSTPAPDPEAAAAVEAREDAPPWIPPAPEEPDAISKALATAVATGRDVEVDALTTTTSVTTVTPEGKVRTDTAAGPIRVRQDGQWVPVDTTLVRDGDAIVPKAVVGERSFSDGGDGAMASLRSETGDGLDFTWPEALPTPTIAGDTATYADVLPDTDLVLTATRNGFSQKFVVRSKPKNAAELAELSTVTIPVEATGASLAEGRGGQLELRDDEGNLLAQAAAPLAWDAKVNPASGDPAAVQTLAVDVEETTPPVPDPGAGETPDSASDVTLSGTAKLLTDPKTVYPVTIDPSPALASLGDTFVQSNIASTPQGGSTDLKVGTYNGGGQVNRSYLRFDVAPIKSNIVTSATLSLWNNYSYSCTARQVDLHEVADFNANTLLWSGQPADYGVKASASGASGYSSSCPARAMTFNVTDLAKNYATNSASVLAVSVTANEGDSYGWKIFNSGNAASNVPVMTVTYDDCTLYGGYRVCGAIRERYRALGGSSSYLGNPSTDELTTPDGIGRYNHFAGGSIYWTNDTGAHNIDGPIRDKWASMGWETSLLGYPTVDEFVVNGGAGIHFQGGSIYYSAATGAHYVKGAIRALWADRGWETSYLGFPVSDEYPVTAGLQTDFTGGSITWDRASAVANYTAGPTSRAGSAGWFTTLPFTVSATVQASVNVGTGNLNVSVAGLSTPGIGGDRPLGVVYNSLTGAISASEVRSDTVGYGWRMTDTPDARLSALVEGSARIVDGSGRARLYLRNADGTFTSPAGDQLSLLTRPGGSGDWTLTYLDSGRKLVFRAADGMLLSDSDRSGVAYTFSYNAKARPTTITGTRGNGNATTITYDATTGNVTALTQTVDGTARTVRFGYDTTNDLLTSSTDAVGGVTKFAYTGRDLTQITSPAGTVTSISYNTGHRVTRLVNDAVSGGFNRTWKVAYPTDTSDTTSPVTTVTNPRGDVSQYTQDAFGKIVKVVDPRGAVRSTTYAPNLAVATAVDAMSSAGSSTSYSYNSDGSPASAKIPTGATASATYNQSLGRSDLRRYQAGSSTDAQNQQSTYAYDGIGNQTKSTTGAQSTSATYNPPAGQATTCVGGGKAGQVCSVTDGNANTTTLEYDSTGNLRRVVPPSAGVIEAVSYSYDGAGRTKTVTDGRGQVTTTVFDALDRAVEVRYAGASSCTPSADTCIRYTYDGDGNVKTRVDVSGTTTYSYDKLNRETTRALPAASGSASSTLSYDLAGNVSSFTDATGTTAYAYDKSNDLTSVTEAAGGVTNYAYDLNGFRTKTTYPGGTSVTATADASGRATRLVGASGAGTLMDLAYAYTRSGGGDGALISSRTDRRTATAAVQTYTYDALSRLLRAVETAGSATGAATAGWFYCYDGVGNRTVDVASTTQTACGTANATYDATNALTSRNGAAFSYDANGNETSAAVGATGLAARSGETWNAKNQLTKVTTGGTARAYAYSGASNKERVSAPGSTFANTALGITTQTGTGANTVTREPDGTPVALRVGGASYYYLTDIQGSTIALVDSSGAVKNRYSYDPYGNSRSKTEAVANPYQYIGGYLDATTGLYKLGIRYYDPTTGRFTQTDPTGESAHYAYADNDPVGQADPSGAISIAQVASAAAEVAGFISTVDDLASIGDAVDALLAGDGGRALNKTAVSALAALVLDLGCNFTIGLVAGVGTVGIAAAATAIGCSFVAGAAGNAIGEALVD